ncbi:hypothetical protein JCM10914A_17650 [Paenibacillus sp. JCM 10914]|uniref:3'-5' exonuclease n=1 Tax=Paenibacillus sp. JCM 10914 TaxID=1236974 RepID=UPI0003CC5481|nr:3'-5' exonuclease [Paenibacillus sp. JCM 10914]GAE06375.1 hypothetical protein JCM10914_2530 [Paenibacillus sp. JCM 10914]
MAMYVRMKPMGVYEWSGLSVHDIAERRFSVIDLESFGNPGTTGQVFRIRAMRFHTSGTRLGDIFETLIRPTSPIPQDLESSTGVYNREVAYAPSFSAGYKSLQQFLQDDVVITLGGYEFDLRVLQRECERHGLQELENPCIDLRALYTYLHPEVEEVVTYEELMYYYGFDDKPEDPHDPYRDMSLLGLIYIEILEELRNSNTSHLAITEPLLVQRSRHKPKRQSGTPELRFPPLADTQRKMLVGIIMLFFLTIALTGLVDVFTFRLSWGGGLSGNGNPALLIVMVLAPLYVIFLSLVGGAAYYFFQERMKDGWYSTGILGFLLGMAAIMSLVAYFYHMRVFVSLGGRSDQHGSAIFRFSNWNQYSNTAYVNVLTYSLGIILSMLIGYLIALLVSRKRV